MRDDRLVVRVFPRRTKATPTDELSFIGEPGLFVPDGIAECHISVAFTWDIPEAEKLAAVWSRIAPVKIGGPAYNQPSGEFEPGRYLKPGYVITSRGCPNRCWFCSVWRREQAVRELEIKDGWNLLDDNILACSDEHIKKVFAMLSRQKNPIEFTGGLEAKILKNWHIEELLKLRINQIFFAYDTLDDFEPLKIASEKLLQAEFKKWRKIRAYVLIGYKGDTFEKAEKRLQDVLKLGIFPAAMLYRDKKGERNPDWLPFQREWYRPAIMRIKIKQEATT